MKYGFETCSAAVGCVQEISESEERWEIFGFDNLS